jgi:hypothetical protein
MNNKRKRKKKKEKSELLDKRFKSCKKTKKSAIPSKDQICET